LKGFVIKAEPPPPWVELERFYEADEVELRAGGKCFDDVSPVESSTEARVSRALSRHEQMFA